MIHNACRCLLIVLVAIQTHAAFGAEERPAPRVVETVHTPDGTDGQLRYATRYRLWIPEGTGPLRALIVHQHGCGKGAADGSRTGIDDLQWQALARATGCGLLVPTYEVTDQDDCRAWCDPRNGSDAAFLAALDRLASESGHPEVATIPWCLWGHSGGGFWATIMLERHPERIVAIWLRSGSPFPAWRKGEIPELQFPDAAFGVPIVCNPGLKEKGDARFASAWTGAVDTLEFFRGRGAPVMFAPDPITGHECGASRTLAIPFFREMLGRRLPEGDGPLRAIDLAAAFGAALDADDQPGKPVRLDAVANPARSGWLPDEAFAAKWLGYVRDGFAPDDSPPPVLRSCRITRLPNRLAIEWEADADLESGLAGFIIRRGGEEIARLPEQPAADTGRALLQGISYHDTPTGPTPSLSLDLPAMPADGIERIEIVVRNAAGLESPPWTVEIGGPSPR